MKYVMLQATIYPHLPPMMIPVIFPDILVHKEMAEITVNTIRRNHNAKAKVVSAGFINIENNKCFGESASLNIKSRDDDTDIMQSFTWKGQVLLQEKTDA